MLSNKTYDFLKTLCLNVLPALATLVIAIGEIWGIKECALIAATITAVATFIGSVLKSSSRKYWEGGNGVG